MARAMLKRPSELLTPTQIPQVAQAKTSLKTQQKCEHKTSSSSGAKAA